MLHQQNFAAFESHNQRCDPKTFRNPFNIIGEDPSKYDLFGKFNLNNLNGLILVNIS